jgi:hypothetical protein
MTDLADKKPIGYHIIDRHTGAKVGHAKTRSAATRSVDKRDNAYGAYRYHAKAYYEQEEVKLFAPTLDECNLELGHLQMETLALRGKRAAHGLGIMERKKIEAKILANEAVMDHISNSIEHLDEISASKVGRYLRKSSDDKHAAMDKSWDLDQAGKYASKERDVEYKRAEKRQFGIDIGKKKLLGGAKQPATEEVEAEVVTEETKEPKTSIFGEQTRYRAVESSIREIMSKGQDLRKEAKIAEWNKHNPTRQL